MPRASEGNGQGVQEAELSLAMHPADEAGWLALARGYRVAGLLLSAHRLGLLQLLAERGPLAADELAEELVADERVVAEVCRGLWATHVLERVGDRWTLSDRARSMVEDRAVVLELDALAADYRRWGELDQRARLLRAGERPEPDPYSDREPRTERAARRATQRLLTRHADQAKALVEALVPTRGLIVLDVGGGDGVVSREVCRCWPEARCVVLEQPAMAEVARRACAHEPRIAVCAGDFFGEVGQPYDELPGPADVVILSHVLQGLDVAAQRALAARAARALAPGGCLVSCELVLRPDERGPLDVVLWAVGEAAEDSHGHLLTTQDQDDLVRAMGLAAVAEWWVSDDTRALLGVRPDVGSSPALRLRP